MNDDNNDNYHGNDSWSKVDSDDELFLLSEDDVGEDLDKYSDEDCGKDSDEHLDEDLDNDLIEIVQVKPASRKLSCILPLGD